MSQERPTSNPNSEHPDGFTHNLPPTLQAAGQTPRFPAEEASTVVPTPNRYWRFLNDPGFTPLAPNPRPPAVSTEAFLGLTQLEEVQRDFVKSKEEVKETSKGGSLFVPEIQDKPVPPSFRLPILEPYDGSTDPSEHVTTFRAQMALYGTSDALMCRVFPMTLKGLARMWYSRLKPSSISSFDHLVREFELNFIVSSHPRSTTASLLGLTQGSDEPLAQFVGRFMAEVRRMPDAYPSLRIQAFLMGLHPSRFFWSLIERPPSIVPEMLQWANQYVATEMLVAGKREDHKRSRNDKPQGQPPGTSKRRDRPELPTLRPLPIPLNSTRIEVFLQIRDKELLRTPNPIKTKIRGRDKKRYCHFHRDYRHDTEECNDLKNQIEDLIRRGHLHQFV
ncbi:hypothetical protein BHE74_00030268 [Ensete ventricosum]|nr:hypothetical protein BHE74_00030268 [Ensete ventricosum]